MVLLTYFLTACLHIPTNELDHALGRSGGNFSGPPDCCIKVNSNNLPEQSATPGRFNGTLVPFSVVEVEHKSMYRLQEFCLFFAEIFRVWRRVTTYSPHEVDLAWITLETPFCGKWMLLDAQNLRKRELLIKSILHLYPHAVQVQSQFLVEH